MSDHETEFSPMGSEAASDGTASYSSNGSDSGGFGEAGDRLEGEEFRDDGASFLADLAKAMQSTAASEQQRNVEATEQRRQAHIDGIRAREAIEAEDLRELAKDDVKGIDAWSDGEIKRIKLERERRIASRREQLQIRLEEHHSVVAREVENVESAISAYRTDVDRFFYRLETETDPVEIARLAGARPAFPVLELIGPDEAPSTSEYAPVSQATAVEAMPPVDATPPEEATAPVEATADVEPTAPVEAMATPYETPGDVADASASGESGTDESGTVETSDHAEEPQAAEAELVGVMDPEASTSPAETPWQGGEDAQVEARPDDAVPVTAESETPETQHDESAEEPVTVAAAQARVVMPRSTGAGSWLRWPNSSSDRPDSDQ